MTLFQEATAAVEKVEAGLLSPDQAASQIMSLINSIDFLPPNFWRMADATQKDVDLESDLVKSEFSRCLSWVKTSKKIEIKKYFDYDVEDLLAAIKLSTANR